MRHSNFEALNIVDIERNKEFVRGLKELFELPVFNEVSDLRYNGDDADCNNNSSGFSADFANGCRLEFGIQEETDIPDDNDTVYYLWSLSTFSYNGLCHVEEYIIKKDYYRFFKKMLEKMPAKELFKYSAKDLSKECTSLTKEEVNEYFVALEKHLQTKQENKA